jgi:hypothetical protein
MTEGMWYIDRYAVGEKLVQQGGVVRNDGGKPRIDAWQWRCFGKDNHNTTSD